MSELTLAEAPLECPICEAALSAADEGERVLSCKNGRSFDIAREGYVNLLPSQHRSRGIEGDTADMLGARREFLGSGVFEPLLELLAEETRRTLDARKAPGRPAIVEVGCGEGYYIGGIADRLADDTREPLFLGSDLSKRGVQLAAKRHPGTGFFVADLNRRLYLQSGAAALLLDIFAPRNPAEFARILEPGGRAIVVIPSARHMAEARARYELLEIEPEKERRVEERFGTVAFRASARRQLEYPVTLSEELTRNYIAMGPNRWHERAREVSGAIQTLASFTVLEFERLSERGGSVGT